MRGKAVVNHSRWNEVMGLDGKPRAVYQPLLDRLPSAANLRELQDRFEATLHELGMTFEVPGASLKNTWFCDLLGGTWIRWY
jgi:uncharacterized circularly permuted ATP-grasp superfamily protein